MKRVKTFPKRPPGIRIFLYRLLPATALALSGCVEVPLFKKSEPAPVTEAGTIRKTGATASKEPLYKSMSRDDRRLADRTVRKALETALSGTTFRWHNPDTGHSGTVTPLETYQTQNGYFCRSYRETLTIAPRTEQYRDQACRDKKGIWRTLK